ncbi:hypothetical protein CDL12_04102 [Handroanthus impetiginosus]|uniref:Uncharacterized protein n=1 Tax=Handroanthus impetiginosus TaxID=429701 RepID=A0A2G9I0A2_9LAMI|nr:hypothetical protein CDL12_04102 [Handroanthus impetiginosus]
MVEFDPNPIQIWPFLVEFLIQVKFIYDNNYRHRSCKILSWIQSCNYLSGLNSDGTDLITINALTSPPTTLLSFDYRTDKLKFS